VLADRFGMLIRRKLAAMVCWPDLGSIASARGVDSNSREEVMTVPALPKGERPNPGRESTFQTKVII
jgi:hypothetical protein